MVFQDQAWSKKWAGIDNSTYFLLGFRSQPCPSPQKNTASPWCSAPSYCTGLRCGSQRRRASAQAAKLGPQPLSLPSDQTMTQGWFLARWNRFRARWRNWSRQACWDCGGGWLRPKWCFGYRLHYFLLCSEVNTDNSIYTCRQDKVQKYENDKNT